MSGKFKMRLAAGALALFAVAALGGCGKKPAPGSVSSGESTGTSSPATDVDASWDEETATKIALSGSTASVSGDGAAANGSGVVITAGGDYVFTGSGGGTVTVDTDGEVRVILNGAELDVKGAPAIYVKRARSLTLILGGGTDNLLSSSGDQGDDDLDGALWCECQLGITGSGSLAVNGGYKHGVVSGALSVAGGTVTVTATEDCFHISDSMTLRRAALNLTAGSDGKGITVENDSETASFYMESGEVTIPACNEGIEANKVTVAGGTVDITAVDDGINANGSGSTSVIEIKGGDITVKNGNGRDADGLDSNGDIFITGGRVFVSLNGDGANCAIDYGTENGGEFRIDGGTVLACGGSAMAESVKEDSEQGFIMKIVSGGAGSKVTLKDVSGKTLLSEEVPYAFSLLTVSVPGLEVGDKCTLTVGGEDYEITVDNSSVSGGFGGGPGGPGGFGGGPGGRR